MHTFRRLFDQKYQDRFARISSDRNPIHTDALAARRTHAGAPIVHGIHSLCWVLDCFSQSSLYRPGATALRAQFLRPIYVGDDVTLELLQTSSKLVRARIVIGTEDLVVASIGFDESTRRESTLGVPPTACLPPECPRALELTQMADQQGCLTYGTAISGLEAMFPFAANAFGHDRMAALINSSCLVGMVVPGLHSMYSGLDLSLQENRSIEPGTTQFAVKSINDRFRLVRIEIRARGLSGFLETVSRRPPVNQPRIQDLSSFVTRGEFAGSVSLIIGGSRGLGELTAKLIAAGGGDVLITYATGKADAESVVEEIAAAGGNCSVLAYDVRCPAAEQLVPLRVHPTHLYYFATPVIARRKEGLLDASRLAEFHQYYIAAFRDLMEACIRARPKGVKAFYPSTTFIESRPAGMTEYVMSKAAAEILCADLSRYLPGAQVIARRLPRLPTDQTISVAPVKTADPIEVMLPILRELHQSVSPTALRGN